MTVLLAFVLFLVAVGQRFKVPAVRIGVNTTAFALLVYSVVVVASLPRL